MTAQAHSEVRAVIVQSGNEQQSAFVKASYGLMYSGPVIQLLMILLVSFYGYSWVTTMIDYTGWFVRLGNAKSPEALVLRTQAWLIFATYFFMVVQIVGALVMPFHIKVSQVIATALSIFPLVALGYVVFSLWHTGLQLDDLQRNVLWFQFWSVAGGFLLSLGARMAIMSGRKTGNLVGNV